MRFPEINEWVSAFGAKKASGAKPSGVARLVAAVLWTAALASVVTLVFLFVLPSHHSEVQTPRTCGPYLFTPGYTVPHWDIVILEGNPLEVFCILDAEHVNGRDHNATDLRFYRNGTLVGPPNVTVVNETAVRYYVERPTPMKAMLFCNLKPRTQHKEIFVCLNMITVKPDHRVYNALRTILGLAVLFGVSTLGFWYARRFYKAWYTPGDLGKTQANTLSGGEMKDSRVYKITQITWEARDEANLNSRSADKQEGVQV